MQRICATLGCNCHGVATGIRTPTTNRVGPKTKK